jgi:glycosyltransferase involved in cell wall biosynthesis
MRIGLVSGEYPPDQGGVGDFTRELGRALVALGHEVHVLTTPCATPDTPQPGDPTLHRTLSGWGWGCWRELLDLAADLHLDVLDVQYQAAAYNMHPAIHFVPRKNSPPVMVTFHDLKVPYLFPKAGPVRRWIVRLLARRAGATVTTNQEDYLQLEDQIPRKQLHLIPIGSNIPLAPPPDYDRDGERARWSVGREDLLLGYFGFLNASKGGEELMRALALLAERGLPAHLLKVGGQLGTSDPTNRAYARQITDLIAELGLAERVHWTGYTDPRGVSAGLLATDVCVLPYRDGASFRRGTLHACLTHGRAIVTTRPAVDVPEMRHGENLWLVPPGDAGVLADGVAKVVADPALRARLEAGAAALAAEFAWERIARQTASVLRRMAA